MKKINLENKKKKNTGKRDKGVEKGQKECKGEEREAGKRKWR